MECQVNVKSKSELDIGGRETCLVYSPGPGLWSLVLGPFGPDLRPDLDLTWDLDLDLSLTIEIRTIITNYLGLKLF